MRSSARPLLLAALLPLCAFAQPQGVPEPPRELHLEDPFVQRAVELTGIGRANATHPRAIAALAELHALRDEVPDLNLLWNFYTELVQRRATHPEVRNAARMLLADVVAARGFLQRAENLHAPLGHVRQFHVVGSFDNEGKAGCDVDHGPEAEQDLARVYPTRHGETAWRAIESPARDGYVDLSSLLRPHREAVAYALSVIEASGEARAELSVGAGGAFRLWVNGERVLHSDDYNLPRPDQARVAVRLRKGHNRVLLKVCQDTGPFGFYLRHQPAPGAPESKPVAVTALEPVPRGRGALPQVIPTASALLAREVQRRPDDAGLRADYARVLHFTRAFDERSRLDVVEAERAAGAAPEDVWLQLHAARVHQEDHNLRRRYLERALAAVPGHPLARLQLAEHLLERDRPAKALELLEPLVKSHPRFARAHLALADAWAALDEVPKSQLIVEALFRRASQHPQVVREAARVARRLERHVQAQERYRAALGLRHDDAESRRALAVLLAELGRPEEAAREWQALLRLWPWDLSARMRLGELLAANGEVHAARRLFDEARTLLPDEPELHEREGRALLHAGRRDEALTAFEQALTLRPQNPSLREAMRSLQGLDAAWGLEHVEDVAALAKEAAANGALAGEDAVILADYVYTRVQPTGQSSRFHQLAVKVQTQRGVDSFRVFPITWSPARQEVQVLRVRITRPDGSVIESFGDHDRNINEPWTGMYYDARARELSFPALAPGDVLELRYRIEDTARENLLSDYWGDVAYVQTLAPKLRWSYLVDMPAQRPLYWNRAQLGDRVQVEERAGEDFEEGRRLYRFSAQNVSRIVPEPSMPGWAELATTVHVSTYETWDGVARYWWGLVRDQLVPDEALRRTVDTALSGVDRKDERAVVSALYDFVVTHTRYVALEFGIHGFKPYRVDRVLSRRFGDCKDKASLLYAMLQVAGVDSRLVLLRMRHLGDIGEEVASLAAFNHAILYVPSQDLWLDGTAAFHGASELPSADRAANVLVIEPDGTSTFLTTPEARAQDNDVLLALDVGVQADGRARVAGRSIITGQDAPEYRRAYATAASRRAVFEQGWSQLFPGLRVGRVEVGDLAKLDAPVQLDFDLEVPRYAEVLADGGLRLQPFGSPRTYAQAYAALAQRTHDLVLPAPWTHRFRFRHALPQGFAPADLPADVAQESAFGTLRVAHRIEDGMLVSEAALELSVARVKAKDYPAFRAFLLAADHALSRRIGVGPVQGGERVPVSPPK